MFSFQSPLSLAHHYWGQIIQKGDTVIDATAGNGHDALFLAQLAVTVEVGSLYAIDINPAATTQTAKHLEANLTKDQLKRIYTITASHASFPAEITPASVSLIVYNLGYLPGGGDKLATTMTSSTLDSIVNGLPLLKSKGVLSITCYPGHPEGALEENALLEFAKNLPKDRWLCCHHRWLNRQSGPSLLLIQKMA